MKVFVVSSFACALMVIFCLGGCENRSESTSGSSQTEERESFKEMRERQQRESALWVIMGKKKTTGQIHLSWKYKGLFSPFEAKDDCENALTQSTSRTQTQETAQMWAKRHAKNQAATASGAGNNQAATASGARNVESGVFYEVAEHRPDWEFWCARIDRSEWIQKKLD